MLQEFLIEELAKRAFAITAKSNRDIISYSDVGGCTVHSTIYCKFCSRTQVVASLPD